VSEPPDERRAKKEDDVALLCASSPDGETLGVLRKRGDRVEAATMRRASDGQPIQGELVRLLPREEPLLFDVEVVHDGRRESDGPAQVATEAYRKGWERLFKSKRARGDGVN
jgi:hypothetical protein